LNNQFIAKHAAFFNIYSNTTFYSNSLKPARSFDAPRTQFFFNDDEPLPGISPLETRVGARLHAAATEPRWAIELEARIVDNQDRVATSLFEQETPGFTIWNLRSYWQARENLMLIAGAENFTDKFYQEHLDYRTDRSWGGSLRMRCVSVGLICRRRSHLRRDLRGYEQKR